MGTEVTHHDVPPEASGKPWLPLLLGLASVLAFPVVFAVIRAAAVLLGGRHAVGSVSPAMIAVAVAIALGVAGLMQGLRALVHHERSRRVWAGTVLSGVVACCWTAFALAEAISPA